MRTSLTSRQIAERRGVGRIAYERRDAPTLDLTLDLATATGEQLEQQRAAALAAINAGTASGDVIERASAIGNAITEHNARVARADAARQALLAGNVARTAAAPDNPTQDNTSAPANGEPQTAARMFTQSAQFRAFAAAPHGSMQVSVPGHVRAIFGTTNYPSQPTRVPGILVPNRDTPLTVLDLIDRQSIDTNSVEWVQETGYPNSAAAVAEGAAKPESTFGFELKQDSARVIAHWVKFTRQVLQDESQVQGYIEGRLTYGLLRKLNEQVIAGDGVSPNLRGILATSGLGAYTAPADEDPLISVRRARTVAELSEYPPDAVLLHPTEWERIELSTNDNGSFRVVANNVAGGATPRIWGLNVILSTVGVTASTASVGGIFLVGGFREGATLWERTGVEIYLTDSHASDFTSNLITMLAELRAVLSVWRPKAFVKGTFAVLPA